MTGRIEAAQNYGENLSKQQRKSHLNFPHIENLRRRLLDLSGRNNAISYRHSMRSARQLRVIDENPDVLFAKLQSGEELYFRAIPDAVDKIFPDEQTDIFKKELREALKNDSEYLKKTAELKGNESKKAKKRLEAELKDRLRQKLGMPPVKRANKMTEEEVAKENNLNPSFDLDFQSRKHARDLRHKDNEVQTLHFEEELDARLHNIFRQSEQSQKELGIGTLYCVFGFLEWYESESSEKAIQSPLMLFPVQIAEKYNKNIVTYPIGGRDEEIQVNLSLQKRLLQDFGIGLPDIDENDTPASYIIKVQDAIKAFNDWRVSPNVTLGFFSFAKLAMYDDLNPESWEGLEPRGFPILQKLLSAEDSQSFSQSPNSEIPVDPALLPPVVTSTDSSQLKAIIEVCAGRSLVIQGPPGTGKSQTITNIIATSMAQGKKVLFVAEKDAALKVVKSRLDEAGLAPFCLELHSDKTNRSAFLQSIKERAEYKAKGSLSSLKKTEKDLTETTDSLKEYYRLLFLPLNGTQITTFDAIWKKLRHGETLQQEKSKVIEHISLRVSEDISNDIINRQMDLLQQFENRLVDSKIDHFDKEPWWDFIPHSKPEIGIESCLTAFLSLVSELQHLIANNSMIGFLSELNLLEIQQKTLSIVEAQVRNPDSLKGSEIVNLRSEANILSLKEFRADLLNLSDLISKANQFFSMPPDKYDKQILSKIQKAANAIAKGSFSGKTFHKLCADLAKYKVTAESLSSVDSFLKLVPSLAGAEELGIKQFKALLDMIRVANNLPRKNRKLRTLAFYDESNQDSLEKCIKYQSQLADLHSRTAPFLDLDNIKSIEGISNALNVLKSDRSIFRFFRFTSYYPARKIARGLVLAGVYLKEDELILKLQDLISMSKTESQIRHLMSGLSLPLEKSLDSKEQPFSAYLRVLNWSKEVKATFSSLDSFTNRLREFLLKSSTLEFDRVDEIRSHPDFPNWEKIAREVEQSPKPIEVLLSEATTNRNLAQVIVDIFFECNLREDLPLSTLEALSKNMENNLKIHSRLDNDKKVQEIMPDSFRGAHTIAERISDLISFVEVVDTIHLPAELRQHLISPNAGVLWESLQGACKAVNQLASKTYQFWLEHYEPKGVENRLYSNAREGILCLSLSKIQLRGKLALENRMRAENLRNLIDFCGSLDKEGIADVIYCYIENKYPLRSLAEAHAFAVYSWLLKNSLNQFATTSGLTLNQWLDAYKQLDSKYLELNQLKIAHQLSKNEMLSGRSGRIAELTEDRLINHYLDKETMRLSIRQYLENAAKSIQELKPCLMMSPLAVAKYLVPGKVDFDLLVIDEASQVVPEDAIGAIMRSAQVVVVGDAQQLPPTNFFQFNTNETLSAEDSIPISDEDTDSGMDSESILEWSLETFRPAVTLLWHYRSEHETLIDFSNKHFYQHKLIVPPSPIHSMKDVGVCSHYVGGPYKEGRNHREAEEIVDWAIKKIHEQPDRSMILVTVNREQRELVDHIFFQKSKDSPFVSEYLAKWQNTLYPFAIKNLESVQGDERDIVAISTVYGPSVGEDGTVGPVFQRFGPITGKFGHRRLNVLFTRAKFLTMLFTSMKASDILIKPTTHRGPQILQKFLEYAAAKGRITGAIGEETMRPPDSDFEINVANALKAMGFDVRCQVGVAGFFVDIGVLKPGSRDEYLVGIECDGKTYHSTRYHRDRDKLRETILRKMNWEIYRIWSTDWFRNPSHEIEKLASYIKLLALKSVKPNSITPESSVNSHKEQAIVSYPVQGNTALKLNSIPAPGPTKNYYEDIQKKYTAPDHQELLDVHVANKIRISKSKIVEGLSCEKKVYLSVHNPTLKQSHSLSQQARFASGEEVGVLARNLFKNGLLIETKYWEAEKAIEATKRAIANGHNILYEASFGNSDFQCRVDILQRELSGNAWSVYEVKSGLDPKPEYIRDLAIQCWILNECGIKWSKAYIIHLNRDCKFPDLNNMFVHFDATEEVNNLISGLGKSAERIRAVIRNSNIPDKEIGKHCDDPYTCAFKSICWKDFPKRNVFDLPGIGAVRGWKLISEGKTKIEDLNEFDFNGKTQRAIHVVKSDKRWTNSQGIKEGLAQFEWPLYFLDFETLAPVIPRYSGTSPYSDVPFQFSCHIWRDPNLPIEHFEYLHLDESDPRPALIQALISGIGESGSVVAFNKGTESGILKRLAEHFPKWAVTLNSIAERLVDPLPVFRENFCDPVSIGDFSIKALAPAILGEKFNYSNLVISDGLEARAVAEKFIRHQISGEDSERLKNALLEYCRLDTLAMLELVKWMYQIVKKPD